MFLWIPLYKKHPILGPSKFILYSSEIPKIYHISFETVQLDLYFISDNLMIRQIILIAVLMGNIPSKITAKFYVLMF